ncbi:MAG: PEP-CTERM sorting domain-containing protein [Pirellulales bacterium]
MATQTKIRPVTYIKSPPNDQETFFPSSNPFNCNNFLHPKLSAGDLINGSFENGLTGWQVTNSPISVSSAADYLGVGIVLPTDGVFSAVLDSGGIGDSAQFVLPALGFTANDFVNAYPFSGTIPANWMPGGQIAMLYQSFNVNAGDKLSFDWNFVGLDAFSVGGGFDFSWWALKVDGNPFYVSVLGNQLGYSNGLGQFWTSTEFLIQNSGVATVYFAASGDVAFGSKLHVDNVRLSISAVPEPNSLILSMLIGPMLIFRRRKSA